MRRVTLTLTVLLAVAATLAGCGIGTQSQPEAISPPSGIVLRTPAPPATTAPAGRTTEYLYFVDGSQLVRVSRRVPGPLQSTMVIHDLLAGPDAAESARGYTSALLGQSVVASVKVSGGSAIVELAPPVADSARNDEVLAYGQLVSTLTALPQVSGGVMFTNGGKPIAVPRGDGSLSTAAVPLLAADYAGLVGQPATATPSISSSATATPSK